MGFMAHQMVSRMVCMGTINGKAVEALREARHLSNSELARRVGVTRQHMGRIQHGICGASDDTIRRTAKALGVEPEAIGQVDCAACAAVGAA